MNDPQQTTQWQTLPEEARSLIQRDVEEAFARDDRAREDCSSYRTLGADCDRSEWEKVRELWG